MTRQPRGHTQMAAIADTIIHDGTLTKSRDGPSGRRATPSDAINADLIYSGGVLVGGRMSGERPKS